MTSITTDKEPEASSAPDPSNAPPVEGDFGDVAAWVQAQRDMGTSLGEEWLWREAWFRYRALTAEPEDLVPSSEWARMAAATVFESPGTPRHERDAAREAVAALSDPGAGTFVDQARELHAIADRRHVERSKILALLAPGFGFPWMFPRVLWTGPVFAGTLEAVLARFDWTPGSVPSRDWLLDRLGHSTPAAFLSELAGLAPAGSDLFRLLTAMAAYVQATERDGKDSSVIEPHAFLRALEYGGLPAQEVEGRRPELLALRSALLLVTGFQQYRSAEASVQKAEAIAGDDPTTASRQLRRGSNLYKRLCVAQSYAEPLLQRYHEVCRKREDVEQTGALADTRNQHVLLVSTLNSPADLQRLLLSVLREMTSFAYRPQVHVIVSDDSSPDYRARNVGIIAQASLSGLSISHWDLERKNAYLAELNREVFPDGRCDVRDLAGNRKPGEKGVPYGRFRNFLRLIALKEVREMGLDRPILTWLDHDNQLGALVLTKSGALSERHVFDYFDQKSELFNGTELAVGGGGYTNDALEGVEKFWVAWGILHTAFGLAEQHGPDEPPRFPADADITRFRPWDQPDTLERLRREGEDVETICDQVLLLFSTLVGTFRGKYDNQVQIYHPWTFGYVEPGDERLVEERRPFAGMPGGNTTFTWDVLASPIPFITVGGRGEDIFHLWQIEAENGPGSVCLTHTPALHTRNVRTGRSDLMTEIIDSYNGRIFREPAMIWSALAALGGSSDPSWRPTPEVEADTAAAIANLQGEAKGAIAAVSGFAAAIEPYLDDANGSWWMERAEVDPRYGQVLATLRNRADEFKDAGKYQRLADEKLMSIDEVRELTNQFVATYPHWQTVVEHVSGIRSGPLTAPAMSGPAFAGYTTTVEPQSETRPASSGRLAATTPPAVEPLADPTWREVLNATVSLFRRFEKGRADADLLLSWQERVQVLADTYRHYAGLVGEELPAWLWTRVFRDALLVPFSVPYAAVSAMLSDEFWAGDRDEQRARIAALIDEYDVERSLLLDGLGNLGNQ